MTGLSRPTGGTIEINGKNINEIKELWKVIGICPQHDTIWNELTVEEHLFFYCRLRGIPRNQIAGVVRKIAEDVGLDGDPFCQFAGQLSGGQKRRLSIAISMTASPRVVVLDEPTVCFKIITPDWS